MLKVFLIFIQVLVVFYYAIGQEFTFELAFEDAVGNRDTIDIGYDPNASEWIDTQFNEADIRAIEWDSVFEVVKVDGGT